MEAWTQFAPIERSAVATVVVLYRQLLGREPDLVGLRTYVDTLIGGGEVRQVIEAMLASTEYHDRMAQHGLGISVEEAEPMLAAAPEPDLIPLMLPNKPAIDDIDVYGWWAELYEERPSALSEAGNGTGVSLLLRVDPADRGGLMRSVDSLHAQTSAGWRAWLLTPPGAAWGWVGTLCREDRRLARVALPRPAWLADRLATRCTLRYGRFAGFLASSDRLASTAIAQIEQVVARHPEARIIFTDEDALDAQERRHLPWFKTDWDPELLSEGVDPGGLLLLHRDLVARRGWHGCLDATADLRLLTTCAEATPPIFHIDRVLYHRRTQAAHNTARVSLIHAHTTARAAAVRPSVSIVIPTRDRVDLLRPCLEGLLHRTDYDDLEIVLVDNGSVLEETRTYLREVERHQHISVVPYPHAFNWGAMNNAGAARAGGEVLVLLNNDIEVMHPDWLSELAAQAMRRPVGVVGAKLLYPSGALQHGGMLMMPDGSGHHVMRHAPPGTLGYRGEIARRRTVSAVTGACMAIRRDVFDAAGGIEQRELEVTCSDVDLCLRVRALGYRVVWTPYARLLHRELATRGADDGAEKSDRATREQAYLARRWGVLLRRERYRSSCLTLCEDYPALALPPRWPD